MPSLFCRGPTFNLDTGLASGPESARIEKEDNVLSLSSDAATAAGTRVTAMAAPRKATSDATLALIVDTLSSEKAEDIVQIDLRGRSEMGDHMVIATGRSTRQVSALSEKIMDKLKSEFGVLCKVEGKSAGDWVLIDAGDVIVHLFRPEVREFYQLEKMWLSPSESTA